VEFTKHYCNLFAACVGPTGGGKGMCWSTPRYLFSEVDSEWARSRVTGGLSSGEGIVHELRDAVSSADGTVKDVGASDKRLFLLEEELGQGLRVMMREGSILSPTLRQAWDSGNLHPIIKNNSERATNAHLSIIGHITQHELKKYLGEVEKFNGLCNRFIWLLVGQSKFIPNPMPISGEILAPLIGEIRDAVDFARAARELKRDTDAAAIWAGIYRSLRQEKPEAVGAITRRGAPIVMRVATIYALLEKSNSIQAPHLKAALALWDYAEKSAHIIFGDSLGDKKADKLRLHLAAKGRLTLTEIHSLFSRNESADEIQRLIEVIVDAGLGKLIPEEVTAGKSTTILVTNYEFNESTRAGGIGELSGTGEAYRSNA